MLERQFLKKAAEIYLNKGEKHKKSPRSIKFEIVAPKGGVDKRRARDRVRRA